MNNKERRLRRKMRIINIQCPDPAWTILLTPTFLFSVVLKIKIGNVNVLVVFDGLIVETWVRRHELIIAMEISLCRSVSVGYRSSSGERVYTAGLVIILFTSLICSGFNVGMLCVNSLIIIWSCRSSYTRSHFWAFSNSMPRLQA